MTAPRQVLPGTTYLVTRRCSERRFFLRPDRITNAIFRYVLALAASRHGIQLHAFCVLSNHFHLVVTDPEARLPSFMQYLDSLVGRAVNAARGRWEHFWDGAPYSAVVLTTPSAMVEKVAYVLANPVAAGLVRRAVEWPGLWSAPALLSAGPQEVPRPQGFFRKWGAMPASVPLQVTAPPGVESLLGFRQQVEAALARLERRHGRDGRRVLGAARVLAQSWRASPEPTEPRRGIVPRIAGRDGTRRGAALARLREFLTTYRVALRAWRRGRREVTFPAGTYAMRVLHGVSCLAPS